MHYIQKKKQTETYSLYLLHISDCPYYHSLYKLKPNMRYTYKEFDIIKVQKPLKTHQLKQNNNNNNDKKKTRITLGQCKGAPKYAMHQARKHMETYSEISPRLFSTFALNVYEYNVFNLELKYILIIYEFYSQTETSRLDLVTNHRYDS